MCVPLENDSQENSRYFMGARSPATSHKGAYIHRLRMTRHMIWRIFIILLEFRKIILSGERPSSLPNDGASEMPDEVNTCKQLNTKQALWLWHSEHCFLGIFKSIKDVK